MDFDIRTYNVHISRYMFLPFERLVDSFATDYLKDFAPIKESTVYAIGRVPKISFLPESFVFIDNYKVLGEISIAGKKTRIMFNMAKLWYEDSTDYSLSLQREFKTIKLYTDEAMSRYKARNGDEVPNHIKYQHLASIDITASNETTLHLSCPLAAALDRSGNGNVEIPIYQLLQRFEIDCIDSVDICYIGKSVGTLERLRKHEKWLEVLALTKQNPSYDYFAYFFTIDDDDIKRSVRSGIGLLHRDYSGLPSDATAELCEAALINYFKPILNTNLINSDLSKLKAVKRNLRDKGYNNLVAEVELDGVMGRLSSSTVPYKKRHVIEYNLEG